VSSEPSEAVPGGLVSVQPGEGLPIPGAVLKLSEADTGQAFSVVENRYAPGLLLPPHAHRDHDQCVYVIQGVLGSRVGSWESNLPVGSYLYKPRNVVHTHWNSEQSAVRMIELTFPAGFEGFLIEFGRVREGGGTMADLARVGEKYNTWFDFEWVDDLRTRHQVDLAEPLRRLL
jgi:quercetin dioxygenase-like cupin family protein